MPRIEVTFDIDVNGILSVSARDQRTGKEQRLVVNPTSGLSARDVREALAAAESHAAEDRRRRASIDAAAGLQILAKDVVAKATEFRDRLPHNEADEVMEFCQKILVCLEEMKETNAVEEIMRLNEELQKRALELFQKSSPLKVSSFVISLYIYYFSKIGILIEKYTPTLTTKFASNSVVLQVLRYSC